MSLTPSPAQLPSSPQQKLPVALCVPPELLLDIFTLAAGAIPTRDYHSNHDRRRTLRKLTLVHRKWTGPAQELLQNKLEVWFDTSELEERNSQEGSDWRIDPTTKYLGIWGNLSEFLKITGAASYPGPVHVTIVDQCGTARLDKLAYFTSADTLHIEARHYVVREFEETLCFRNLRRLTIRGLPAPSTRQHHDRVFFKPERMPNLQHLALEYNWIDRDDLAGYVDDNLDRTDDVMASLDDQITTLALRRCDNPERDNYPTEDLPRIDYYPNLRHFACQLGPWGEPLGKFFPEDSKAELESIHLTAELARADLFWLDNVRKGRIPGLVIKRIVLYGDAEWLQRYYPEFELGQYEWRDDMYMPFEDFDGR